MESNRVFLQAVSFLSKLHQMEDDILADIAGKELTGQQKNILTILHLSGSKNLSALSECLHMNLPNCSREVKKLVQKNFVRKEGSCLDKRIIELSLTPLGQEVVIDIMERLKEAYFRRTGTWDSARMERIKTALDVLEMDFLPPEK